MKLRFAAVLLCCAIQAPAREAPAQDLPDGFFLELAIGEPFTGEPVGFARLPDGRVLLIERPTGVVRLAAAGAATSDPIAVVPGVESVHPERGLLGVAVDPAWPARPYVYVYYNHTSGLSRVTMYTASGDLVNPASTSVALGSPFHLLTDLSDVNGIHNGGALRFGPDGMLHLSLGDDALACRAQTLDSLIGGILRLDVSGMPGVGGGPPPKSDLAPADNPFLGLGDEAQLRFAWGLRNPFRFTIDAPTGLLVIGDVGSSFFEEIDLLDPASQAGANYGWPQLEGPQEIFCCGDCGEGNAFTNPVHVFPHPAGVTSIVAGPIVRTNAASPVSFPPSYEGDLIYFEFFSGVMRRLVSNGGSWTIAEPVPGQPDSANWATGIYGVSDAQIAPDGAIEMVSFGIQSTPRGFYRLTGPGATSAPSPAGASRGEAALVLGASPNPAARGAMISFSLHGAATAGGGTAARRAPQGGATIASLEIEDVRGRLVRRIAAAGSGAAGNGAAVLSWDGRDESGRAAAPGVYFARALTPSGARAAGRITLLR